MLANLALPCVGVIVVCFVLLNAELLGNPVPTVISLGANPVVTFAKLPAV